MTKEWTIDRLLLNPALALKELNERVDAEPVAAMTTDYLGCEYVSMDVASIEKIAAAGSKGPTEVVFLYAAPPAPSVAVKALQDHVLADFTHLTDAQALSGPYIVKRIKERFGSFALSAQVQDAAVLPAEYYSDDPAKLKQLLAQRDKWLVDNGHWHDFTRSLPAAPAKQD